MGSLVDLGGVQAYRAEPDGPPRGALILIHEIWGLVIHIREVADRFADEGYLVLAPDLLSDEGITPDIGEELHEIRNSPDESVRLAGQPRLREAFGVMRAPGFAEATLASLRRAVDVAIAEPGIDGRVAVLGFCFGGSYAFALAAADDRVRAAVPFYGDGPDPQRIHDIRCPILAFYGADDERIMAGLPELEDAMTDAGVAFTSQVYSGVGHAFFNETGTNYDEHAAEDAWATANAFLSRELAGSR